MNFKNILFLLIIIFVILVKNIHADEKPLKGNLAVFYIPQNGIQMNALAEKSTKMVLTVFEELGRFLPVERNRITWALKGISIDNTLKTYNELAKRLKVDVFAILAVYRKSQTFYAHLKIFSLSKEYNYLRRSIIVNSKIATNIPLKLGREIAYMHEKFPIKIKVTDQVKDNYIINAGQWHGLTIGSYKTSAGNKINIIRTDRYYSLAKIKKSTAEIKKFEILTYPKIYKVIKQINDDIHFNTEHKYGLKNTLLKKRNVTKKYMQGVCVINPGANFCLPGYGSHLATRYLGFKKISPSIPGVVMTSTLSLVHMTLTPMMTGFNKGVKYDDHSKSIWDLQIFMWSTLPLVWTVGYLDQLAHQFRMTKHLPPFFYYRNVTAMIFSFFIPGGGLFYKGYRLAGWVYYLTEMSLLSYAVYSSQQKDVLMYTLLAFSGVKLIELINAFFIKPAFDFYNFEKRRKIRKNSISFGIIPTPDGSIFALNIVHRF